MHIQDQWSLIIVNFNDNIFQFLILAAGHLIFLRELIFERITEEEKM